MQKLAFELLHAIQHWRFSLEIEDRPEREEQRQEIEGLVNAILSVSEASLPNGQIGLVLLAVRRLASRWQSLDFDECRQVPDNDRAIAFKQEELDEMKEGLILHGKSEPAPLVKNDVSILCAMLEIKATVNNLQTSEEISRVEGASLETNNRHAFDKLKALGLVASLRGVGFYLTLAGIERAKTIDSL